MSTTTTMDSDPVAPIGVPDKKMSPWFQFVIRVRTLTGLSQPDAMRLAGELRSEKAIDAWTDAEVSPRGTSWLRTNYLLMTPTMLREKIGAIAALADKQKEVGAMSGEVSAFLAAKEDIPATADLSFYYNTTVPKLFTEAMEEMYSSASQDDAYAVAMDIPDTIREKMKEIQTIEASLQKEAAKAAQKASKEAEKAAAKIAKEAEKEAAKAALKAAKAAEKETKAATSKKKESSPPATKVVPAGGAGSTAEPDHVTESDDSRRKGIPKHIKTLVWNKYIGASVNSTKCLSCREELISIRSFHCGHVIAEAKGGDSTINNLWPICAPCNSSMGTMSMNDFTKTYFGWEI